MKTPSTTQSPLISIITLSYNYARFLPHTIEAILSQDYKNIQHIIIDDASTDDSVAVARAYAQKDKRIEVITSEKNRGACAAYAEAYKHINGDFVCSIDADDVPHPTKFRKQLAFFSANPDYDLVSTFIDVIDGQGKFVTSPNLQEEWVNKERDLNDLSNWISGNYIAHSAVMMRREAHDKVGVLDPNMVYAPDYEHFTRFVVGGHKIATLPERLMSYRVHGSNITHKNPQATFIEFIYIFWKWIAPVLIQQRKFPDLAGRLSQIVAHDQYAEMSFQNRMRLLSSITQSPSKIQNFLDFSNSIANADPHPGSVLEAALSHSPANLELRSMLRTTSRMSSTINRLAAQIEANKPNHHALAEHSQRGKLTSWLRQFTSK
ncbi:glycosyltransferase [Methylobacterium sp. J-001]|uniref:glycosyltransferase family 2 protein n=1 Tax=Methylobacterium sp. J-001 TaxID=2836609 RepID=UPI001FB8C3D4|nr:glycosyltransferase [Methylobacterium sp. J-001]MCJ2120608.1 glycosyltransferase [Methylobacterium sp. J-001]